MLLLFASAFLTVALGAPSSADTLSDTYANVRQSIALVVVALDDGKYKTGTGFCVYSDQRHSVYLTNHHVIGSATSVGVFVQGDSKPYIGRVLRVAGYLDAALIDVPRPNTKPLTVSVDPPTEGTDVAVAGYPASQFTLVKYGLNLVPALHHGTVSALPAHANFIEYDAHSEHGNSGSPVFDSGTGVVYGMETYGFDQTGTTNLAIAIAPLLDFINNAHVTLTYAGSTAGSVGAAGINSRTCMAGWTALISAGAKWQQYRDSTFLDDLRVAVDTGRNTNVRDNSAVLNALSAFEKVEADARYAVDFIEPTLHDARAEVDGSNALATVQYADKITDTIFQIDYYSLQYATNSVKMYQDIYSNVRRVSWDPAPLSNASEAQSMLKEALQSPVQSPCTH
jgi:hypothetical protein